MASDDPFAEPDDADKTVIKPNPGGRRRLQQASAPSAPAAAATTPTGGQSVGVSHAAPRAGQTGDASVAEGMTGMNRLNAAASTLFSLVSRIRNRAQHLEADKLRQSVVAEVRNFETRALADSIPAQDVKVARYAICATLDDVVLNTPWGGESIWAQQPMVGTFHKENVGGDRFYDLLARLEQDPATNIELLEFLYMCLSLGFEGRLRVEQSGADKHMQIRAGLARIIRSHRGPVERALSPHWEGVSVPHKVRAIWKPVWITAGIAAMLLTAGFMSLSYMLNQSSERVLGQMSVLTNGQVAELFRRAPPPPPPPPPPTTNQITRVEGFLEQEIDDKLVELFQDNQTITVRIAGSNMFGSGSDVLQPDFEIPLSRVAAALNEQAGPVIVVGHSDSIPIQSSRFPSNMHLSLARAESVLRKLAGKLDDPDRLQAQGRAAKDPIAGNDTREGRARNRRIEILLIREDAT